MTHERIRKENSLIDDAIIDGKRWELWEDCEYGDEAPSIATDGNIFVYTWESLQYTVDHIADEYEPENLD